MDMVMNRHLEINIETVHKYVSGPATLKKMTHMLSNKLERGAISMYLDVVEPRVFFQQDVTIEPTDTITNDQAWHQFTTIDHHKDVKELVSPQWSKC